MSNFIIKSRSMFNIYATTTESGYEKFRHSLVTPLLLCSLQLDIYIQLHISFQDQHKVFSLSDTIYDPGL